MFARVAGVRIGQVTMGSGDPVCLLHGWGGEARSFHPVQTCLAEQFATYAIDFPGFGRSALPPATWGVGDYAECVRGWLDELGITKTSFVGHSFGGRVAIVFATRWPERVDRLVLVDSAGIRPRRTLGYHARVFAAKAGRRALGVPPLSRHRERLEPKLYAALGAGDYSKAGPLRSTFVRVVNEDLRSLLPSINAPTLLVWGDRDDVTPVGDARIMAREIPNARLEVFTGAGHFSYLDRPAEFCRLVRAFLAGTA